MSALVWIKPCPKQKTGVANEVTSDLAAIRCMSASYPLCCHKQL